MIRVKGPDGSTFTFPEGTDEKTINDAMAQHYGQQTQSQPPAPAQAAQPAPASAPRPRTSIPTAAAAGAADAATFGFADEIAARNEAIGKAVQAGDYGTAANKALGYLTAPGRALYKAVGLSELGRDYSDDPQEAARREEFRGAFQQAARDRPLTTFASQVAAGSVIPLGAAGALPRTATARQRAFAGARAAAPQAVAYGYGSGTGDEREEYAATGAVLGPAFGAAFGAAAPAIGQVSRPISRAVDDFVISPAERAGSAVVDYFTQMPKLAARSPTAMSTIGPPIIPGGGGAGRQPPRATRPPPQGRDPVIDRAAQLALRQGKSYEQIADEIAQAQADPRGRVLADVLGENAQVRVGTLSERPGQTKAVSRQAMQTRQGNALGRLQADVEGVVPGQSVVRSEEEIAAKFRDASKTLYKPALSQRIDTTKYNQAAGILTRFPTPVLRRAERAMQTVVEAEGRLPAQLNEAEFLHFMKVGLDDAIRSMKAEGLQGSQLNALTGLQREYVSSLDNAIPGYDKARKVWAGFSEEREALEAGQMVFGGAQGAKADVAPDRVAADVAEYSEAGKAMFEAGVRSAVRGLLQSADKGGRTNVSNALASTARRNVIKAALGEERAQRLFAALDEEARLFEAAKQMMPGQGSKTFRMGADSLDEIATNPGSRLNPARMLNSFFGAVTSPVAENWRNQTGKALLTPIDSGQPNYSPQELDALLKALRRQMYFQQANARTATAQGAGAGVAGTSTTNR